SCRLSSSPPRAYRTSRKSGGKARTEAIAMKSVQAEPYSFSFDPKSAALVIIDMQRDFVDPGGFGEALGNDVSLLRKAIAPTCKVLDTARRRDMLVIHTREGHRPDLSDLPASKKLRGRLKNGIGDPGPMGRILV